MAATTSSPQTGWKAAKFDLEGTDGRQHRLAEISGPKGTLVMFICNHCPYVQAVLDDIIRDARELEAHGVRSIAIMPNDTRAYPAHSFENMKPLAPDTKLALPYVIH
jgi:peroxiredoxin